MVFNYSKKNVSYIDQERGIKKMLQRYKVI